MLKFSHIFLTLSLSLFTLFFNTPEENIASYKVEHLPQKQQVENSKLHNAFAIETSNNFGESLNFGEDSNNPVTKEFFKLNSSNRPLFKINLNYLKTCSSIYLKLTVYTITFPFHSFL